MKVQTNLFDTMEANGASLLHYGKWNLALGKRPPAVPEEKEKIRKPRVPPLDYRDVLVSVEKLYKTPSMNRVWNLMSKKNAELYMQELGIKPLGQRMLQEP